MKAVDSIERYKLIVCATTKYQDNENIDYPEFLKYRAEVYKMLQEIASETRCQHQTTDWSNGVCITCGRKANPYNTLPVPLSIPEAIDKLKKSLEGK